MATMIIDAGHGPKTPGKRSPDGALLEFQFNCAVAELLKLYLQQEGIDVFFSHEYGRDVPLWERTAIANRLNADAFVSIHANAYGNNWNEAHGIETFTYPQVGKQTSRLAEQIHHSLVAACGRRDRGIKTANFAVLRETKMPAVLVECGFMTNREEANLLLSNTYRVQCARAISFGVLNWLYFT
ncbi:N-acetylmuramoyl-L-alanine amidase [Sporosarcina sp. ACRSL]|uniref:N-acetylmuramoyl-L-alanine amidase family protein n=1 Tax=Sporosarcina sp. ACRSL TaxID=2918215 RepID=UPI001EF42B7B|nr:N-acetylmuramoyl-L-alanine amidase [Sporosarcina sp. ACRSL]MCG7345566.1 N-acetylmuramoyl-L-alanine amidase [Sporosarcina sp. ACRSL]